MESSRSKQIFILLLTIFIDSLGWGVVYPVFSTLFINNASHLLPVNAVLADRHFWFELSISIYLLCMFITSPLMGTLSDRYGRKKILIISLFGNALGFVISAYGIIQNSVLIIFLGRIVSGCTAGSLAIAQAGIVDISQKCNKAVGIAWITISNGIGFTLGPALGSLFLDGSPVNYIFFPMSFYVCAILAIIGAILVIISFKDTFSGNLEQKVDPFIGLKNLFHAFNTKTKLSCYLMLFFTLGWNLFFNEVPIFLNSTFSSRGSIIGYFLSYVAFIYVLSLLVLLPKISKRVSLEKIIIVSLLVQLICQTLFVYSHSWVWIYVAVTPLVVAVPLTRVGITTQASNMVDNKHQGQIMGVMSSILALTWGGAPFIIALFSRIAVGQTYFLSIGSILIALILGFIVNQVLSRDVINNSN